MSARAGRLFRSICRAQNSDFVHYWVEMLTGSPQTGLCIEEAWMARETGHLISLLRRQLPLKGKLEEGRHI